MGADLANANTDVGEAAARVNLVNALFTIGDYIAGAVIGAVTAVAVHGVVWGGMDMVLAAVVGVLLGMVIHVVVGILLTPVLGAFHVMLPGSLIGMYGGMMFAMRDAMQGPVPLRRAALIGAVVSVILDVYDRALHAAQSGE